MVTARRLTLAYGRKDSFASPLARRLLFSGFGRQHMNHRIFSFVTMILLAACGYTTPYQATGPVTSREGVGLSLAGESCYVNRSGEQFPTSSPDDILHLAVNVRVANRSSHPAQLSLDRFQLAEEPSSGKAALSPGESGTVVLSPGESKTVELVYQDQTDLDCHRTFALEANNAVSIDGKPVAIASIDFRPVH
jgi:hypothetical protein